MAIPYKTILQSAFLTLLTLFGGILTGVVVGNPVFERLSGHSITNLRALHVILGVIPAVTGVLAGSGAWGWAMGGLANVQDRWRMVVAGILGFVPITILLAFVLLKLEGIAVDRIGVQLSIHRVFTLLFVPAAFLIAGISAWAIGSGLRDNALAVSILWRVGFAAALAFLIVNLVMEASGCRWRTRRSGTVYDADCDVRREFWRGAGRLSSVGVDYRHNDKLVIFPAPQTSVTSILASLCPS
jgi:hypothetical protein